MRSRARCRSHSRWSGTRRRLPRPRALRACVRRSWIRSIVSLARSRARTRFTSSRCCRKRAPANSCVAQYRLSPRDALPGTSRPSKIPPHWSRSGKRWLRRAAIQTVPKVSPSASPHAPLAIVSRGEATESVHYGSVAVVDAEGRLLFSAGDPEFLTTTRSALKPLQALPFVAGGGVERFGFSTPQVALLCASHSGEPRHTDAVADMLSRIGCVPEQLLCGVHPPLYYAANDELPPAGARFSTLHHNCSGKHTGMLAYCRQCGLPLDAYVAVDHPLQQAIRTAVAHLTGVAERELVGVADGCSAPNYAVP